MIKTNHEVAPSSLWLSKSVVLLSWLSVGVLKLHALSFITLYGRLKKNDCLVLDGFR